MSVDPASEYPVLLAGVRDEFHDRPWIPPGRHWPEHPELIGGQDLLASGTWLAVDPAVPRAACVLNGRGPLAPESGRLSRGELPLRFAATGTVDALEFARYDPFHLICATLEAVFLLSWNGEEHQRQELGAGLHVVVNSGLEGSDPTEGPGTEAMQARLDFFRPRLLAAPRPEPAPKVPTEQAWGPWLPLVDGDGLDPADDRALLVRREFGERTWGTTSVTLVGLRAGGVRYDFSGQPGDAAAWVGVVED
ncbi:hypothetical protein ABH920_004862 [Catenulispora sp. EB89]|uniref:NRDE family protein n=1 Tax=Catenulispora sp. EB89 TaxID=3156257 RepID=UPI00351951D7